MYIYGISDNIRRGNQNTHFLLNYCFPFMGYCKKAANDYMVLQMRTA